MNSQQFYIITEQDDDGFFISCPQLPGCYSQGATYEEAQENIKDAIKLHVLDHRTHKELFPKKTQFSLSSIEVIV